MNLYNTEVSINPYSSSSLTTFANNEEEALKKFYYYLDKIMTNHAPGKHPELFPFKKEIKDNLIEVVE